MKKQDTPVTKFQISNYGQLLYNGYPIKMAYGRSFMATTDDSCYTGYETTDFPWVTLETPLYLVEEVQYEPAPVYRFSHRLAIEALPMRTGWNGRGSGVYRSKIFNVTADHFIVDVKTYLSWGDKAQKREFIKACVKVGVFPSHAFLKGHYGRAKRRDEQRLNDLLGREFFDLSY